MSETWLPMRGHNGYEISNLARVRSLDRIIMRSNGSRQFWKGQLLKPAVFTDQRRDVARSYRRVRLEDRKWYGIAVLMLETFVRPRPYPKAQARHLNDDSLDDRLENLAWGSQSQNWDDAKRNGRIPNLTGGSEPGEAHPRAKLTTTDVLAMRAAHNRGVTNASLARRYKIDPSTVSNIVNHKAWRHLTP